MDVLTAYADKKGWVTAKAGRPDVGRAGNSSKQSPRLANMDIECPFKSSAEGGGGE
jgi:hypothetical protein